MQINSIIYKFVFPYEIGLLLNYTLNLDLCKIDTHVSSGIPIQLSEVSCNSAVKLALESFKRVQILIPVVCA